jgi:hypothetical protein
MNNPLEINGIVLSEQTLNVLKRWQSSGGFSAPCDPERYIEYLNDIQDYLTRVMLMDGDTLCIAEILTKLILIKDDLKLLIPKKEEVNHD